MIWKQEFAFNKYSFEVSEKSRILRIFDNWDLCCVKKVVAIAKKKKKMKRTTAQQFLKEFSDFQTKMKLRSSNKQIQMFSKGSIYLTLNGFWQAVLKSKQHQKCCNLSDTERERRMVPFFMTLGTLQVQFWDFLVKLKPSHIEYPVTEHKRKHRF